MSTEQSPNHYVPDLDELLTPQQCVAWMKQGDLKDAERWLRENERTIVPFRPSHKVKLYHPRTILAKMAFDAGVPLQIIAASYGVTETAKKV